MKKTILILCLVIPIFGIKASAEKNNLKWQNEPLLVDGNTQDWGEKLRFYHSGSKIQFDIRNDDQNLYIVLKSNEKSLMKQLMTAECKITFKTSTKPSVNASIDIQESKGMGIPPTGDKNFDPAKGNRGNNGNQGMGQNQGKMRNQMPDMKPEFQKKDTANTKGFIFSNGMVISGTDSPNGISFAKNSTNESETAIEFRIPLKEFFGENFSLNDLLNNSIKMQVVINSLSGNNNNGNSRGGMQGPGGGMGGDMGGGPGGGGGDFGGGGGGFDGGGMGGPPPSMNGEDMEDGTSTSKINFKTEFILASKTI